MKRSGTVVLLAVTSMLWAGTASAATTIDNAPSGAHYRKGSTTPVCSLSTGPTGAITVSCTGTQIAGVGNTNADLLLEVEATAHFVCRNPGNDKVVEPHSSSVSESTSTTLAPSRNGTLVVPTQSVTLSPQDAAAQFTCPNPNWREQFTGLRDPSYTYSLTFAGFDAAAILVRGPATA